MKTRSELIQEIVNLSIGEMSQAELISWVNDNMTDQLSTWSSFDLRSHAEVCWPEIYENQHPEDGYW